MKTIGVLGGIGPQATMEFELRLHRAAQQLLPQHGNMGYPPTVVVYVRHPPFLVDESLRRVEPPQADSRLFDSARKLGTLADFLVITSNASHVFLPQIEAASGRKVLSMIGLVLDEIRRRAWKRVGVLGLAQPKIYLEPLRAAGIECETIEPPLRDQLDQAIFRLMEGRDTAQTQSVAKEAVASLLAREVDGIILGCTEIPPLLADPNLDGDPRFINPLVLLADAAVRHAAGLQSRPLV